MDATFINSSYIQCVTPIPRLSTFTENIIKHIGITINGYEFFDSPTYGNVNFTYHPPIGIKSISPPYGPIIGGTLVTIIGENFVDGIMYQIESESTAQTAIFYHHRNSSYYTIKN